MALDSTVHDGKVYVDFEQLLDAMFSTCEQAGHMAIATNNEALAIATRGLAEVLLSLEQLYAALFVQHGLTEQE